MLRLSMRIALSLILVLAASIMAQATTRVALVIGNSAYTKVAPLRNPQNDANAMADSLERLDFTVVRGINLDRSGFVRKIREFSRAAAGADVALFFYAGHGLQVNGSNYLAPIDATIGDETDLEFEAIQLSAILGVMEREERINLVFLDACRDNPMTRSLSRSMGTRSTSIGKGLAPIETGSGTLIGFATQPGNVALDGEGTFNSPFTTALLKHINTPNLDVAQLMRRVRKDVKAVTNGRQIPWTNESLTEDFAFLTTSTDTANDNRQITVTPVVPGTASEASRAWEFIKNSKDAELLEAFIDSFGGTFYASLAKKRLAALKGTRVAILNTGDRPQSRSFSINACDVAAADSFNKDNPSSVAPVNWGNINKKTALSACRQAVQDNPDHLRTRFHLARVLHHGANYPEARRLYKSAVDDGYAFAASNLGFMYNSGLGVDKTLVEAAKWYRIAAEAGHTYAQNSLASAYYGGRGVVQNRTEAVKWYRRAAELGYAISQDNLGNSYYHGIGVNQSYTEAVHWYRVAAAQGHAASHDNLGNIYFHGKGVTKSYTQAVQWYRKGTDLNYAASQSNLGYMYEFGHGVTQNHSLAFRWYKKSADQNHARGMARLGAMYEYGKGVTASSQSAADLYYKALSGGDKWPMIKNGWRKNTAIALQKKLKTNGYYSGKIDGSMGSGTKAAMKNLCGCNS